MTPPRRLEGVPASPGLAAGPARSWAVSTGDDALPVPEHERPAALATALAALAAAAAQLTELAAGLTPEDAEIVETGALMAADPSLISAVESRVRDDGLGAPAAIVAAAEMLAAQLAAIDEPMLAARASDVRSLGQRAARLAAGTGMGEAVPGEAGGVVIAADLGPADVAELGDTVVAIALAAGGTTGHAAIVARSLGIPMVVGAGPALLGLADGELVVVDGDSGCVVGEPAEDELLRARAAVAERRDAAARARESSSLPATTRDGVTVGVLANVAGAGEVGTALDAGAEGVGLLRTELAFLESTSWPTEAQHRALLEPILAPLAGRTATVRLLDFGGDKTPPFLTGTWGRGIGLLLRDPAALRDQLTAVLAAGRDTRLRLLIPMVVEPGQVRAVRDLLTEVAGTLGTPLPLLGAMIEVPAAVSLIDRLLAEVDFVSVGTNDLTALVLGLDRSEPGARPAHHPAVLRLVDAVCRAARPPAIPVDVCGEAASDPVAMPLLVGLGVDELSVGASRVGRVRAWVRALDHAAVARTAAEALEASSAAEVEQLVAPTRSALLAS